MKEKVTLAVLSMAVLSRSIADTVTIDGVEWLYSDKNVEAKTVSLGDGTNPAIQPETVWDAGNIPSSLIIDGESYTVTKIKDYAFKDCIKLSGKLLIPDSVETLGKGSFYGATGLTRVAPLANVSTGNSAFEYCNSIKAWMVLGNANISVNGFNRYNGNVKVFIAGPETTAGGRSGSTKMFGSSADVKVFLPEKQEWKKNATSGESLDLGNDNSVIIYYGSGLELDLSVDTDKKVVTAIPATAHALTNVLIAASTIKSEFGMDTRISITNCIEVAEGTLTDEMLTGVTFDTLTFNVKTQAQLYMVLNATSGITAPLGIDPSGAKETLTLPSNRKVWVLLSGDGSYTAWTKGLKLTVR